MFYGVSLLLVVISAVTAMALGFLWYSPVLFGKEWMKLMGYTEKNMEKAKKGMGGMYALSTVGALLMAFVLGYVLKIANVPNVVIGVKVGFLMWLGFVAPVQMTEVLFGGKSWKLYALNTSYQLASLLLMSGILSIWG